MKRYVLNTDLFEDEFYIKGSRYNKEPKWSGHIEIDEKDYLDFIAEQTTRFITYLKDVILGSSVFQPFLLLGPAMKNYLETIFTL